MLSTILPLFSLPGEPSAGGESQNERARQRGRHDGSAFASASRHPRRRRGRHRRQARPLVNRHQTRPLAAEKNRNSYLRALRLFQNLSCLQTTPLN